MTEHDDATDVPDGDAIAGLLTERWPIADDERLRVKVDEAAPGLEAVLRGPRHRYTLRLTLQSTPDGVEPWAVLVDGLDALFGQLIESGRAHRTLPAGQGVAFQGAELAVEVEHAVPELEKLADQILGSGSD